MQRFSFRSWYRPAVTGMVIALCASGCIDPKMTKGKKSQGDGAKTTAPDAAPANNDQPAAPATFTFPEDNTKLVDRKQILAENPNLVEVENRINAADPISAATQGYFAIGSKAQLQNLKHGIDLYKAEHEKFPPFAEFDKMIKEARVDLKGIRRWQVYAYDDTTGELCILEDREYKKREYEKAGVKLEDN
ncbi:MAG TPA: hypothetical protein VNQ76_15515 [Planctomicrobium sp.]|nr:hypothetical protein [Planctomicrobium sp.]